jgi:hypothetical protein
MVGWVGFLIAKRLWKASLATFFAIVALGACSFLVVGLREVRPFLEVTAAFANGAAGRWVVSQSLPAFAKLQFNGQASKMVLLVGGIVIIYALISELSFKPKVETERRGVMEVGFFGLSLLLLLPYCDFGYFLLCAPLFWVLLVTPVRTCLDKQGIFTFILAAALFAAMTRPFAVAGFDVTTLTTTERLLANRYFFIMSCMWLVTWSALRWDRDRCRSPHTDAAAPVAML